MNKKAAAALGTLGTGSAATATTLATQSSGGAELNDPSLVALPTSSDNQLSTVGAQSSVKNETSQSTDIKSLDPLSLDVVRHDAKEFLSSSFQRSSFAQIKIDSLNAGNDISTYKMTGSKLTVQEALAGGYGPGHYAFSESSLQIKPHKQIYAGGKWKGTLTWIWSYVHHHKGFVTVNKATTSSKDGSKKLVLTGGIYFLEKANDNAQWQVKYKKEVKESDKKILDKSNFDKNFPKPYWYTKEGGFDKYWYNNWEFMNGARDLDKICNDDDPECKGAQQSSSSNTMEWRWTGGPWYDQKCDVFVVWRKWCDPVYGWSGDANSVSALQWYDYMYGNTGNTRLEDHLKHIYKGAWKQIKYSKTNK